MRVPFAIAALPLIAVLAVGMAEPAGAQPPPPPPPRPPAGAGQVPPRDPGQQTRSEPVGTASIRGRVVAADTGTPVRRAVVNLSPLATAPPPPNAAGSTAPVTGPVSISVINGVAMMNGGSAKNTTTDSQGVFEFTGLSAGAYRLMASPGQYTAGYLGLAYGAKRPNSGASPPDMGTPIQLADGQSFDKATIALPRGGVITGRVTDENGDALARVQVYTLSSAPGGRSFRNGSGGSTDDLGQFRLWGLASGDYTVVAEARGGSYVPPNAPAQSEDDKIGLLTTFYPGTADESAAGRVRVRVSAETNGVEIRMVSGRLFQVTGSVVDSQGRAAARTIGNLWRRTAGGGNSTSAGFMTDEQGRFQMRSIAPGTYRLTLQQRQAQASPDGSRGESGEMANLPLNVASDIENLLIVTTPGATITGQISFEQGPPQVLPQGLRVSVSPANPEDMIGVPSPPPASVLPDLTFTMKGLQGPSLLRANAPNQYLKAVMIGGEDISDTPHEFKGGERVTIVLTSRASTLEGNVTDLKGQPATDAALIVFSEDKASWRMNSIRTRRGGVDSNGHYRITGLMPGRYMVAAAPRDRTVMAGAPDTAFFEDLAKDATSVVIGEDEQRQVDLKVLGGGGGQ